MPNPLPNIVFRASAGTGKTHRLVELYTGLVLGRTDLVANALVSDAPGAVPRQPPLTTAFEPDRILLMTFTENAAAELRGRVSARLNEALFEAQRAGDIDAEDRARRRLQQIQSAPICTIHAFCAQVLREHALAAGLSPRFEIIQGTELEELRDQVAYEALVAALENDAHLREICTVRKPRRILRKALAAGHQLDRAAFPFIRLDEMDPTPQIPIPSSGELAAVARELRDARTRGKVPKCLLDFGSPDDIETLTAAELADLARRIRTAQAAKSSNPMIAAAQDWAVRYWGSTAGKPYLLAFLDLALAIRFALHAAKRRRGALDFQDLVVEVDRLLERRPDLGLGPPDGPARFDIVIVDEVQDNSRLQYRLLHRLWRPDRNRLVVCGDLKQSIYGWRDADVRVMTDLIEDIAAAGQTHAVPAWEIRLSTSWRSHPALVKTLNSLGAFVYDHLLGAADPEAPPPVAVEYEKEALIPRATDCAGAPSPSAGAAHLELLLPDWQVAETPTHLDDLIRAGATHVSPEQLSDDILMRSDRQARESFGPEVLGLERRIGDEALAVAARIRLLVDGGAAWRPDHVHHDGAWTSARTLPQAYCFRDITILLRRTTHQTVYEEALRIHGIPYTTGGKGRGFFQRPEVRDIYHLLRVLLNPEDPVSLPAFLRSPFAGLSDPAILALALSGRRRHARARMSALRTAVLDADAEALLDLRPEDCARLNRTRRLLARGRALVGLTSTADLVRQMVRSHGFDAVQSGGDRGETRLANLRKLLDWISAQERSGLNTVSDVVRILRNRIDACPDEPEAPVFDPSENAVRIMTIHGAKGLTQSVVFVPDLRSGRLSAERPLFVVGDPPRRVEVEAEFPGEEGDIDTVCTGGFEDCAGDAVRQAEMENRNLFYVAMTRARDLVVFSGESTGKLVPESRTWRRWLDLWIERHRRADRNAPPMIFRAYTQVRQHAANLARATAGPSETTDFAGIEDVLFSPPPRRTGPPVYIHATALCHTVAPVAERTAPEAPSAADSATGARVPVVRRGVSAFEVSLAPVIDANSENAPPVFDDDRMDPGTLRTEFGNAGHAVFEGLDWDRELSGQIPGLVRAQGLPEGPARDLERRVRAALAEQAALFDGIAGAIQRLIELPFAFVWRPETQPRLVLNGTMDLVWRDRIGWHLLDYKFAESADPEALRERYWVQLALYRRALTQLGMAPVDSRLLVLAPSRTLDVRLDPDRDDPRLAPVVAAALEVELCARSS
ncbi:MAG: UvrD-helicase domain-containing protein [Kiritimatiellaeota bacterium]|nr:UvrD-helicase domain-containing protein [Kiritimatiellota bacterium]